MEKPKASGVRACQLIADLLVIARYVGSTELLLQANLNAVVLLVPLPERSGINLDDGILHQSLCPDLSHIMGQSDTATQDALLSIYRPDLQRLAAKDVTTSTLTSSLFDEL